MVFLVAFLVMFVAGAIAEFFIQTDYASRFLVATGIRAPREEKYKIDPRELREMAARARALELYLRRERARTARIPDSSYDSDSD